MAYHMGRATGYVYMPFLVKYPLDHLFKGEVSRKFAVISKPKNVCLTVETTK